MAKKSMILKQQAPAKFSTRKYNRCKICGRPHAYLRNYGICRICFRELAYWARSPAYGRRASNCMTPARQRAGDHNIRWRKAAANQALARNLATETA